jgi:hypothetical protein
MTAAKYPWESHTIYEPPPLRRRARPHLFLILAALAVVTGALVAVSAW